MSVVILQGEIVHYEVLGRGKPLVFLHGWVGSWRYWIPTMQAASVSFRTYALDLWGFGDTAKTPEKYSISEQASLLNQFLDKMGIGKIALIGHGLGAVVAMQFSQLHPDSVDRVMAISMPNGNHPLDTRMYTAPPAELADWLLSRTNDSSAARTDAPKTDQQAIHLSLKDLEELEISTISQNLATPCLMVYGIDDPLVGEAQPQQADNSQPEHIHQIAFEESGHFPMLDETSKFNRLLVDFLSLRSGSSPQQLQLKEEWKRRIR